MERKRLLFGIILIAVGALAACTAFGAGEEPSPTPEEKPTTEAQSPPTVVIDEPPSGAQAPMNEDVFIQSTAMGEDGVARIDLVVDGAVVRSDGTPDGTSQPQFSLLQLWQPAAMGEHTITVTAYTEDGTASQPATILINVTEASAEAEEASDEAGCTARSSTRLAVREGPGLNFTPLGELQMGQEVNITDKNADNTWLQIDYNGAEGWVYASYAYVSDGCEALGVIQAPPAVFGAGGAPSSSGTTAIESTLTVTYTPGGPTVTPTYTYTPGGPTVTPTYTPSNTPTPTYTYTPGGPTVTPTYTYTPSYTPTTGPTPTYTYTPTTGPSPTYTYTPTIGGPTATYTPSYTPTTQPAAQVAPEDARFNNPLNIPLDNTTSVLDFVSYPGGDVEDRVRWDITGMNPNASLSGGRARLVIAASCFGQGTENVSFFTGGQTYGCGQTLVDREVTYESRTGQVTITAAGGSETYVQWVLTGTATRVN